MNQSITTQSPSTTTPASTMIKLHKPMRAAEMKREELVTYVDEVSVTLEIPS